MLDQSQLPPHLRDDAPAKQCSKCGRTTYSSEKQCRMTQPDGSKCTGVFSMTLHETIRAQLHLPAITIHHAGGTVTLTPEQARAVLAGGELVSTINGAEVR